MLRTVRPLLLMALVGSQALGAFEQTLDRRSFDEAIALGRSRIQTVRTRYHQPYRIQVARPPIDYIDIVTPFRRLVLLEEERAQPGTRPLSQREAIAALGDRATLVEVLVEITLHPLNTFIGLPAYDVWLAKASSATRVDPLQVSRVPRFGARVEGAPVSSPYVGTPNVQGRSQPLTGGMLVASFTAGALDPNGVYDVVVSETGKELARASLKMGSVR